MPEQCHRIICASAGTGKTYRLSLEYIALLLQYYGKPEFSIDNILALTFTRKATAEIRDRILAHLDLLLTTGETKQAARLILVQNLRNLLPSSGEELTETERNILISAKKEIVCDQSYLQVMTIDAYIANIFRNIVRPLRNIESFEIDTQAIQKRMPYLLNHLMKPEFRIRLNKLLSRKVSRSMDAYARFFGSLIQQRWLFYMISRRLQTDTSGATLSGLLTTDSRNASEEGKQHLDGFVAAMKQLLGVVHSLWQGDNKYALEDYFNKDFRDLIGDSSFNLAALLQKLEEISLSAPAAEKLLAALDKNRIWNGSKIRGSKYPQQTALLTEAQNEARKCLADYLMHTLYIPEQKEIIELWEIILKEYDRLIYRYKNMTYDDISWFSFEALFSEDPPLLDPQSEVSASEFYQFLSHRTRFLLIDEFQDTSLIQFNILKPIIAEITSGEGTKPFGGLIVVGDEKQSIFGWRGGTRELLLNLTNIFPSLSEVQPLYLGECWRCGFTLMSFINKLFKSADISSYLQAESMNWNYPSVSSVNAQQEPETEVEFCLRNYSKTVAGLMRPADVYQDFVTRIVIPALREDPTGSIAILCRRGAELIAVQQALDDCGEVSLYQPDLALILHPLVSPLIDWLRFVAWGDFSNLLGFMRSDYVRLNTPQLKIAIDIIAAQNTINHKNKTWKAPDFSSLPLAQRLLLLAKAQQNVTPAIACSEVIDLCLAGKDKSERDYLNLHRFLGLITDWELSKSGGKATLPDFLAYLAENSTAEDHKQASVSADDSLQLLTIHKSKGLQFKRVFVFYNISASHREDRTTLSWALQYAGADFHLIKDFGISYHYPQILKASSYRYLWENERKRELLEEMNNLYVAFTRAESKLHLYFCYEGKDVWTDYYAARKELNLPALLCNACYQLFADTQADDRGVWRLESPFKGEVLLSVEEGITAPVIAGKQADGVLDADYRTLLGALQLSRKPEFSQLTKREQNLHLNWKQVWLEQRSNLLGELAHFYQSCIIRNLPQEHEHALRRCMGLYGSLLSQSIIIEIMQSCKRECEGNPWLFEAKWNIVYNELEVKGSKGLLRIDRLMLNTNEKQALIVDYKTGGIHDPLQLENYRKALQNIPVLQDWAIETRILQITIHI